MSGLRRRTLLRTLVAGPLAGALAGCNDTGGTNTPSPEPTSGEDASPPDGSGPPAPTSSPGTLTVGTPPATAPPADVTATPVPPADTTRSPVPPTAETPTRSGTPPSTRTESTRTPTGTDRPDAERARSLVERLAAGEFAAVHDEFGARLATAVSETALQRYWLGLTAQHGAFRRVAGVERATREGESTVRATVECAEGRGTVEFAFAGEFVSGLWFPAAYSPPAYADQSRFTEHRVVVDADGCPLPGTLTLPDDASGSGTAAGTASRGTPGTVPGAVLVHGSGSKDRDETTGPNKPFRDLAWGLATRGVAVLRYEKRTAQCEVPLAEWGVDSIVVDDAVRAVETLRAHDRVQSDGVVVVGHSLGGTCTPRILGRVAERAGSVDTASGGTQRPRDGGVAGGAMLAANARPITDVSLDQVRHYGAVDGEVTEADRERVERVERAFERLAAGEFAPDRVVQGYPASWWTSLLEYDQVATARAVDAPLALFQGGRDFQVLPDADFGRWQDALADRPDTRFFSYPDLSHLFHPGTEPSLLEEYVFADNVAEPVVADLAAWVRSVAP